MKITMKITILVGMLLAGAMNLQAAINDSIRQKKTDPFYLQLYGGINKSANENLPWSEFTSYPLAGGAFLGLGKEWSPLWGWRMAIRYNINKSRNVQECELPEPWKWHNIGGFADVTLDLTDLMFTKPLPEEKNYRKWNVKSFLGVGAGYTFKFDNVPLSYQHPYNRNSRVVPAFRAGITATYRVAERWRLGAEISHNMFQDKFNGVKADFPMDMRTNAKIGVTYLFTKKKKPVPQEVVMDNRLREVPDLPLVLPDTEGVKNRKITGRAFIDFPVNETVIRTNYRRNPQELNRILATVDSALFDKTVQITKITLHGYASPESPYSNNERLSLGRVAALRDYLQQHYKLNPSQFALHNTPEDWKNLRDFIAAGNRQKVKGDIWYESQDILETPATPAVVLNHQEELLRIIDLQMDEDEKENLLKQVGGGEPYRWLLKYVYPGLRHTDYIIEYVVQPYPVRDAKRLIYTHPEALSLNEMYQVAKSYGEGTDGWLEALLTAAKQFPNDETANLNAASACITMKRLVDAKRYLRNAGDSKEAQYLRIVMQAMEGKANWKIENDKVILIP